MVCPGRADASGRYLVGICGWQLGQRRMRRRGKQVATIAASGFRLQWLESKGAQRRSGLAVLQQIVTIGVWSPCHRHRSCGRPDVAFVAARDGSLHGEINAAHRDDRVVKRPIAAAMSLRSDQTATGTGSSTAASST
jgi:hypothetical protein